VARLRLIRRVSEFTALYPWQWTPAEGEAFIDHLRCLDPPRKVSTAHGYEVDITLFLGYQRDARYGWVKVCEERFGDVPQQVFHEGNWIVHRVDYEGDPRPPTCVPAFL
jgi:integrase/recombinase XerC